MLICYQQSLRYLLTLSLFFLPTSFVFAVTPTVWHQGSYVGAYFGGAFGNMNASTNTGSIIEASYFTTSADSNVVSNGGTTGSKPSSLIGGVEVGHDWVWKQLVYGIVLDYGALPLHSSKNENNQVYPDNSNIYSVRTSIRTNWLFTLRGRFGPEIILHSWPTFLYLTGGMAIAQLKVKNSFTDNSSYEGSGGDSATQSQIGWTAGAGIELASFNHLSVNFEYLYTHIPSVKTTSFITNTQGGFGTPPQSLNSPFSTTGNFYANLIKLGLNYRFDE